MSEATATTFDLSQYLPYALTNAASVVGKVSRRQLGLSEAGYRLILALGARDKLRPSAAARLVDLDKVKVSRGITSLLAQGLVIETADKTDGRGKIIRLTRKGVALHEKISKSAAQIDDDLAGVLNKQEVAVLRRALSKLAAYASANGAASAD